MPDEKKELAVAGADLVAQLRANSGEATGEAMKFIPILQVDNKKEKVTVEEREVDVLCKPRWKRTDRDENGEYAESIIPSFGGVVLKVMWQVANDGKWDPNQNKMVSNDAPNFRSSLFHPDVFFGKKYLQIKYTGDSEFHKAGDLESLTYPELKAKFPELFKLTGWVFFLHNNELVRLKVTGASRAPLFDFLKSFKANDSVSAHPTVCSAEYGDKPQPHNKATFTVATDPNVPFDINQVLEFQDGLNKLFNTATSKIMEAMGGEVIAEEVHEDEIKVENIPF